MFLSEYWWLLLVCVLLAIVCVGLIIFSAYKREEFTKNYKQIDYGMSKEEVIQILGEKYTKSLLKGGIEKLEWRMDTLGASFRIAKGTYVHSHGQVRKVSVKFKDDKVIEVNAVNM